MNEVSQQLKTEARRAVGDALAITGRLVPPALVETAEHLLADVWAAGLTYGVEPHDWRGVASLPTECLDALTMAGRRRTS